MDTSTVLVYVDLYDGPSKTPLVVIEKTNGNVLLVDDIECSVNGEPLAASSLYLVQNPSDFC